MPPIRPAPFLRSGARTAARGATALALLAAGCSGHPDEPGPGRRPAGGGPIVVVAVDGLRADHLGCYGAGAPTPSIDRLAAESLRFTSAFAQAPGARASLATILGGLYPTTSGVVAEDDRLPDEVATLAEVLAGAGYTTAAFVEDLPPADDLGFAQGFGRFEAAADAAAAFVREHARERFFLLAAGWSARAALLSASPLEDREAPPGFAGRLRAVLAPGAPAEAALAGDDLAHARALYARHVRHVDEAVGAFARALDEAGLGERATLVLVGTSGAGLGEHGALLGEDLHAPAVRVPLLVRLPGGAMAGVVPQVTEVVDLMPALIEIAGASAPAAVQGRSLLALARGEAEPPYVAFGESPSGERFVAVSRYHMVLAADGGTARLFDLEADPLEQADLAAGDARRADALRHHVEAWGKMVAVASLDPERRSDEALDPETLDELRSLGYIQ